MVMELSQVNYSDFVVFIFICMIITRVEFDKKYFEMLIVNLNGFFKNFMLLGILLHRKQYLYDRRVT